MASILINVALGGLCAFVAGCGASMKQNSTEFEWRATESGPEHYPMEIIRGEFIYRGQESGLYIPSGATLYAGWGLGESMHLVGPERKPLPDRVDVTFFSYTEKQFYRGRFELPYERILELFANDSQKDQEGNSYTAIMVGVAPGGAVSVWAKGAVVTELFFGQAEKIDLDPGAAFGLPFDSKSEAEAYIARVLNDVLKPEELAALKRDGVPFGMWARYRNLYKWSPAYKSGKRTIDQKMPIEYLNGESNWMSTVLSEEQANTPRPLPRKLEFAVTLGNESFLYIIHFDDVELMSAFEKLGANGEKVFLEFDPKLPRPTTTVRVYNDKESIELKKTVTEDW
jgi:hypothetical protein